MGLIEHLEVAKEYQFSFEGVDEKIKARILKIVIGANAKFAWEVNYYCKLEDEMDVYSPSAPFEQTFEETEHKMMRYIERFSTSTAIKKNSFY
jgi:hypothetical protein